jgi:HEAT repeat protein
MGYLAEDAAPALVQALRDADGDVRHAAALALVKVRPHGADPVDQLIAALADPARRAEAAGALGDVGPAAQSAVGPLAALLDEDSWDERWLAACALGYIGAAPALPALTRALDAADARLAEWAVKAVGGIGPAAVAALPQLARLAADGARSRVQFEAIDALPAVGGNAAAPPLIALTTDDQAWLRRSALRALARIQPPGRAALAALQARVDDPDPATRECAVELLERLRSAGAA